MKYCVQLCALAKIFHITDNTVPSRLAFGFAGVGMIHNHQEITLFTSNDYLGTMKEIFKDLVVVELASVLAGPAVGMFFAELGARVIKFENIKTKGDITRQWKLKNENKSLDYSAYYCSVNYGKEVVMSDISSQDGKTDLIDWLQKADVVISNFKEKSAKRLGIDYASLKALKQDIIYAHLSGYPNSEKVAFDVALQAETGYLSMSGTEDGVPVKMPVALIDILAAHQLKEGILIALLKRYKTGKGSKILTTLYEAAIASLANQATNWLMNKVVPQKMGTLHPNIAPYGEVFLTKDQKEIVFAIGTDQQFENLCTVLECKDLVVDRRFVSNSARVENRKILFDIIQQYISSWPFSNFMEVAESMKIPVGEVKDLKAVFEEKNAKSMILEDADKDGNIRRRVRTIAFSVQ